MNSFSSFFLSVWIVSRGVFGFFFLFGRFVSLFEGEDYYLFLGMPASLDLSPSRKNRKKKLQVSYFFVHSTPYFAVGIITFATLNCTHKNRVRRKYFQNGAQAV